MTNELQAKKIWPTWKQVGTMLGSAIVLGAGGCAVFFNFPGDFLPGLGSIAFLVAVVLFIAGLVALLARLIRSFTGK